jgi:hypothetical protein
MLSSPTASGSQENSSWKPTDPLRHASRSSVSRIVPNDVRESPDAIQTTTEAAAVVAAIAAASTHNGERRPSRAWRT